MKLDYTNQYLSLLIRNNSKSEYQKIYKIPQKTTINYISESFSIQEIKNITTILQMVVKLQYSND